MRYRYSQKETTSLENRARGIINGPDQETTISILQYKQRHACKFVRRCLDSNICESFCGYLKKIENQRNTRNNQISLKLPAVRTEFAKKSTYFMAAKIYNSLPTDIRKEENFSAFCRKINLFFH
jgi:hypothetical protein